MFDSPLGVITTSTDGSHLTGLHIEGDRYFTTIPAAWSRNENHPLLRRTRQELQEYFAGQRTTFDLPLKPAGTAFQQAVWRALQGIAPGDTTSYGTIATQLERPRAARAVGSAVGRNPICIIIPCHRVMASSGKLGGFVAGLDCKRQLLALERTAA